MLLYLAVSRPIIALIAGTGAYVTGEDITSNTLIYASVFGLILVAPTVLFRLVNLTTSNLGINALAYSTPIMALLWLMLADMIQLPRTDLLVIGAIAIIAANLLINFEASINPAYKALIIALWTCGTVVYLHDGFLLPDYAGTVAISATVFILLLSFRMDRLVRRTTEEENTTFRLFNKITSLAEQGVIGRDNANNATKDLLSIDAYKTPDELHEAYKKLKQHLPTHSAEYVNELNELKAEIDILTHSKQQGINFGELTALGFIGIILIFSLLFFQPPDMVGWGGFFVDMSAFMLSAVVLFLFFNILDLQRDRYIPILKQDEDTTGSFSIVFRDAINRSFEQWVSIIVCVAIILSYGWLFWNKWLI